jgi:hypothetical protein
MRNRSRMLKILGPVILIAAAAVLFSSCSTTRLTLAYRNQAFHGTIRKIVVVGVFKSVTVRNYFEDEFVKKLEKKGVDATASHTVVPIDELSNYQSLMQKIRETGADAALVTRLLDRKTVETYEPGHAYFVPSYYTRMGLFFQFVYSPGHFVEQEIAYAETNVYETKNEELIWSGRSRTLVSGSNELTIRSFVRTMVRKLLKAKLIP